jgi:methyl-accepting chemotaxis protein
VVASEVKNLAHQTSKATEEITSHVASIQGITAGTRGAIDGISNTLSEISSIMSGIEVDTAQQRSAGDHAERPRRGARHPRPDHLDLRGDRPYGR